MNRRQFCLAGLTGFAVLAIPSLSFAGSMNYKEGLAKKRLARGEVVFLDFKASWCTTCAAQERVIDSLKKANPKYTQKITFIDVDWDDFGGGSLVREHNVPRRSTLLVLKGDKELGRIVAGTGEAEIKALMDVALAAS